MSKGKQKYGNKKVTIDGIEFDSKKEGERYLVIKEAEEQGIISNLQRQVAFELIPKVTERVIKHLKTKDKVVERFVQSAIVYVCDFMYDKDGVTIVEDIKISPKVITDHYRLKEKIFRWKFGFPIKRVYKATDEI